MTSFATIPAMFFSSVGRFNGKDALLYKNSSGKYIATTWDEMGMAVRETACGLISLGVKPGDRVSIISYNRPEWVIADLAIILAGAITVPIYHTSTPVQMAGILQKSGTKIVFISRAEKVEMLVGLENQLDHIVAFDTTPSSGTNTNMLDFKGLRNLGAERLKSDILAELDKRLSEIRPEDCVTIIYTSGTTADPKGVMLSHSNILSNAAAGASIVTVGPDDTCLSFLPLSHVFERTIGQFLMLMMGVTIAYAESMRKVADDMRIVRPTVMIAVPRFYEKLYARVTEAVRSAPAPRKILFNTAIRIGCQRMKLEAAGEKSGIWLRLLNQIADSLVFSRLKEKMGGRIRFFVSGGAPLAPEIVEFFLAAGVSILEGYGLTESSPVIAVNRLGAVRPGTVGIPLPGVEVKIAEDGEILVKGPNVMLGYYNDEVATRSIIKDGWLHTGDVGELDNDGYLRITDRKKDIIITSAGKNISPQTLENLIMLDEFICQVMVYGDQRKYLTALVVPEYECLLNIADSLGLAGMQPSEIARQDEVKKFLMSRIDERTADLARFEKIKKILVLTNPFSEEGGDLTPTLKVKRKVVIERFRKQLDALYEID